MSIISRTLHEEVFYPPHSPRLETPDYKAIHKQLVEDEDRPCFICGIRNSELSDPQKNPHGVKALETHHVVIEWALTNAVDAGKLVNYLGHSVEVQSWVDHSPENLMVLCDRHHRHLEEGIHALTYPIWIAQKFVRDDYTLTPDSPKVTAP